MRRRNCRNIPIEKQVRVALDYLDGMPYPEIERKHGVIRKSAYDIACRRFHCPPRQTYFSEAARAARRREQVHA